MGSQVYVDVVSLFDAAHQRTVLIETLGMVFGDRFFDIRLPGAVRETRKQFPVDQRVLFKSGTDVGNKAFFQQNKVKNITCLHQEIELVLRHDRAERAVARGIRQWFVVPGRTCRRQVVRCFCADVYLIRHISDGIVIAAQVIVQFDEIL